MQVSNCDASSTLENLEVGVSRVGVLIKTLIILSECEALCLFSSGTGIVFSRFKAEKMFGVGTWLRIN